MPHLSLLAGAMRTTDMRWDDAASTLSWSVTDKAHSAQMFTQLFVRRFDAQGVKTSAVVTIGKAGSVLVS